MHTALLLFYTLPVYLYIKTWVKCIRKVSICTWVNYIDLCEYTGSSHGKDEFSGQHVTRTRAAIIYNMPYKLD